ncbi:MAG TPA: shikimate dehydrogenase [Cerasibacillus sp.]|uniref:shikimate dehydrogenase n=1 Tax=Cerasibacillus sp. TaxID=2498711 RepID=UPI002F423AB6
MYYRLGLIGHPVKQSLSPWIHSEFLKRSHLKGQYDLIDVHPEEALENVLHHLQHEGYHGFNVTVPYKEKIMNYLDIVDEHAHRVGAVNTVARRGGKWIGYNTDGIGYVRALEEKYPKFFLGAEKNVLLIGAGGAARGIYASLLTKPLQRIDLANRTLQHAENIKIMNETSIQTDILSLERARELCSTYDLIIQTTVVGMNPHENEMIMSFPVLRKEQIVSDIVYQPIMTKFLRDAKSKGAQIHLGHSMLLHQAQVAFEIWTDQLVELEKMDHQLEDILKGR